MACTITIGGVTAEVFANAPGVRKGSSLLGRGPWRQVVYLLRGVGSWAQADTFIDALFDTQTIVTGPGGAITWPNPHRYPGNTNLVALEAEAEAVGAVAPDDAKLVESDLTLVTVLYGVPEMDLFGFDSANAFGGQASPFVTDQTRGFMANYPIPEGVLLDPNGDPILEKQDKLVPHIEYVRTIANVPYFHDDVLASLAGKVNNGVFFGRAAGTLRFDDWDSSIEKTSGGQRTQRYTLRFVWRPQDWNYVIAPDAPLRWVLADDGAGGFAYEYADFSPFATGIG